ncbi:MAG: diacylglycerol kinase [Clostridiaceae bacterium]
MFSKPKKVVDSFNYAIEGIIYAVRTQRNMRIHMLVSLLILTACFFYNLSKGEILILTLSITLVIFAELINTAIECTIDIISNYYHPLAKIAKNTAAGAVLVTAINAVFVGYIIFWDKLSVITFEVVNKIRHTNSYMVFLILIILCIITIIIKAIYGEGTPLRGGMPSGHSAISFAIATIIALLVVDPAVMLLSYILALIVAQSRVDSNVHSVLEVFVGALFGVFITILVFRIFS